MNHDQTREMSHKLAVAVVAAWFVCLALMVVADFTGAADFGSGVGAANLIYLIMWIAMREPALPTAHK